MMSNQTQENQMKTKPLRVGAYVRVSTTNQLIQNDSSLDTQLHLIRQRVEYENKRAEHSTASPWKIVTEYREEGFSAKDTDRPALQRLMADVRSGKLDLVVVTKIDRFSRSLSDFFQLWEALDECNVEFVSLGDNFDTSSATGRAMIKIVLVFAELERERTSERTREKIQVRREQGLWFGGAVPLGFRSNPQNKTTLEHDPATADTAKRVFRDYLNIGSARGLVAQLAKRGIKRPTRRSQRGRSVGGGYFTTQVLIDMLSNPAYVAKRQLDDGREITCAWEPLIDESTFARVQALLAKNSEKRPTTKKLERTYLLESLVRCGKCGGTMTRATATGRGGATYFYYRCSTRHRSVSVGCDVKDIPADAIEDFVLSRLREYSLDEEKVVAAVKQANQGRDEEYRRVAEELAQTRTAQQQNGKQLAKLLDVLESDAADDGALVTRLRQKQAAEKELKAKAIELETQRQALQSEILDATTVADSYRQLARLFDELKANGTPEELRDVVQRVVDVVEWKQDPENSKAGSAKIRLFPLAIPSDVKRDGGGSTCCPEWLRDWAASARFRAPSSRERANARVPSEDRGGAELNAGLGGMFVA